MNHVCDTSDYFCLPPRQMSLTTEAERNGDSLYDQC